MKITTRKTDFIVQQGIQKTLLSIEQKQGMGQEESRKWYWKSSKESSYNCNKIEHNNKRWKEWTFQSSRIIWID